MAAATPAVVARIETAPTAPYLRQERVPVLRNALPLDDSTPQIHLKSVRRHNIQGLDLVVPLTRFVVVTGVSGSGKSTLVTEALVPAVKAALPERPGGKRRTAEQSRQSQVREAALPVVEGAEALQRVVLVDQSPLGRTARSTPATYSGIWDEVRKVLASTKDARVRGFTARRFSFLSAEGRCEECKGQGIYRVEMSFLPDVQVICPVCRGMRFNRQTLAVTFAGHTAADILALRIDDAARLFSDVPRIASRLQLMVDVGLGYLQLGQSSLTLSGGEAQRVKLATELSLPGQIGAGKTLYVLDEPTTGLHPRDIEKLVDLLSRLVADGHSVVAIEHEPAFIAAADWVIDLGPEGGAGGGQIVAACSPRELSQRPESATGEALRSWWPES